MNGPQELAGVRHILADFARCAGVGSDAEGWREGCETCLRRTSKPIDPERVQMMTPPPVIEFWCEYQIEGESE